MDSDSYDDSATAVMNEPPRPARKQRPRIHEHDIHGPMIAAEVRTHYERLVEEEQAAFGAEKRYVSNRRWLWEMFLNELEGFHGINGGI